MALTEKQLEKRQRYLGGSDVAALMGVCPWKSPEDLRVEKMYGTESIDNDATRMGNVLEQACADLAEYELGVKMSRANTFRVVKDTRIGVNLDRWCSYKGVHVPVECKTTGIKSRWAVDPSWGEAWTDQVPDYFLMQVTAEMMAMGSPFAFVSAIIGDRGHVMYKVPRVDELVDMIVDESEVFWNAVENDIPLSTECASEATLKRIVREPGKVVSVDPEHAAAVVEWQLAAAVKRDAAKAADEAKARVIALLGDAEAADVGYSDGDRARLADILGVELDDDKKRSRLKYAVQTRESLNKELLKRDYPEAYSACSGQSTFRTLRLVNG